MTQAQSYPRLVIVAAAIAAGLALVVAAHCAITASALVMGVSHVG